MFDVSQNIWRSNINFDTLINFGVHRKKMLQYHHNSQDILECTRLLGVQIVMAHDFFMAYRA